MKRLGIDVSRWQGEFNFSQAKAEGVEFAILKIGGADEGFYLDSKYEDNYRKCSEIGMPIGAYFYGNAMTVEDAEREADFVIQNLNGKRFDYPIYYDVEGNMLTVPKDLLTDIVVAFCEKVEKAGYFVGIYTSANHFDKNVNDDKLSRFCHWVACYSDGEPHLASNYNYEMWQFGGSVNFLRNTNIAGVVVDQNYCYVDYPNIISESGLNNTKTEKVEPKKMGYTIGDEVEFDKIFVSSTSDVPLDAMVTKGRITQIYVGKPNPYLINDGTGWANDTVIKGSKVANDSELKVGDKVKVINAVQFLSNLPFQTYYDTYSVMEVSGDRIVIGNGTIITTAIHRQNVVKVG